MKTSLIFLLLVLLPLAAAAATPPELRNSYAGDAARATPGFTPSAARGASFYANRFAVAADMPSCSACHTERPQEPGRHAITGKAIRPLAPAGDAQRLNDAAKVEKWFRRNCSEVVGRECTAAEKADFIAFLMEAK